MISLYNDTAFSCSQLITKAYSTSFTLGIRTLDASLRNPIYAIYGYVRLADEIVDTFHDYDKTLLLDRFRKETEQVLAEGISTNPILHAFQLTVNKYQIDHQLIYAFLKSMEMDLYRNEYNPEIYSEYIYGSAEVVGLMCLKVFCNGDEDQYNSLKAYAKSLGAAFQKVNFLRDLKSDYFERGRVYFPGIRFDRFNDEVKRQIEEDIQADFDHAYQGILQLPKSSKLGVYLAYVYYLTLFRKIQKSTADIVQKERIRVSDTKKVRILVKSYLKSSLNII